MPAPQSVTIDPGFKLIGAVATTAFTGVGAARYAVGTYGEQRVRITSIVCCNVPKTAGVWVTIRLGGNGIVSQLALPTDGSPLPLTPNESITTGEALEIAASVGATVDVRATGELIYVVT